MRDCTFQRLKDSVHPILFNRFGKFCLLIKKGFRAFEIVLVGLLLVRVWTAQMIFLKEKCVKTP